MHSISTRATTHGRRRNLARFGTATAGAVVAAGLCVTSASAQPATTPVVSIQPPNASAVVGGAPIVVKVGVSNPLGVSVSLTELDLAVACLTSVPATYTGTGSLCSGAATGPSGDDNVFKVNGVSLDPSNNPSYCSGVPFSQAIRQDSNSNITLTDINLTIASGQGCLLDVSMQAIAQPPAGDTVYFLAGAITNDGLGDSFTISSTDYAALNVLPGPATLPAPPPPQPGNFPPPPPSNFTRPPLPPPPPPGPVRHQAARCTPDTPNNGNGNDGYGNNGNGNVGNCNNGNGNVGDDNNGNGNGNEDHGDHGDHGDDA